MPRTPEQREKDRLRRAKYVATNREKVNAEQRARWAIKGSIQRHAYRDANRDKIRAHKRVSYRRNRTSILAKQAIIRANNREKNAIYARTYYAMNREQCVEKRRIYYALHRKEVIAHILAYIAAHPEIARMRKQIRRARKLGAPLNDLTHIQWLAIQEAQNHCCAYCGKRYKGHLTQDHITPLSQGGSHTLHNVIAACRSCNARKGTRAPLQPVQPLLI